ncbi:hypothetical protein CEP54_014501 [Fusarium duplospermum]|uniref:Uncharacterized protein n=1 Tax=Fusarium duplospermum TaxID=1325734 RepID=A0A428NVP8_9HYPO|nr:hypothetical protein CEP54_014501 [Fusarium duplospermum]
MRRRAVRIHEVEEDEPKTIIDRTKEGDGDYAHDRTDDASLGDGHSSDCDTSESVDEQGGDIFSELPADETYSDHDEPLRFTWLHLDIRNLVVEMRHAPGTFSRKFLSTFIAIVLSLARGTTYMESPRPQLRV